MKFKVGDRVEAIKKEPKGEIGTIVRIWSNNCGAEVVFDDWKYGWGENGSHYNVQNDEIKLIKQNQFTKSDLKDGDIVTYRNGDKRTIINNNLIDEQGEKAHDLNYYREDLTSKGETGCLDIVKVERSTRYETVFERKEEILDEAEKRYLRGVIRPFRNKVNYICKYAASSNEEKIYMKIEGNSDLDLPKFERKTMYENMETGKKYILKELGL